MCGASLRASFWLSLFLLLAAFPGFSQTTSPILNEPLPPTRSLKIPPGLTINPSLNDLGETLLKLRQRQVLQNTNSQTFVEDLTTTAPKLEESSTKVSDSLNQSAGTVSETLTLLTDASTTLNDTSKASTAYDASVDNTESDLRAEVSALKGQNLLYGIGGVLAGAALLEVCHLLGWIP